MKKNVAGQVVGAQMVSATDGSAFTGSVSVLVTGDGGTQAAGGGTVTHEGNGFHSYTPTQAETNYDHIAFTFTGAGAVSATVQVYTGTPQTGDTYALANGASGFVAIKGVVDAIKTVTDKFLFDASSFVKSAAQSLAGYTAPLDSTQTQAAAAAAIAAYDPPTRTEATADKAEIITAVEGIEGGGGSGLTGPRSVTLTWEDENEEAVPLVDFTIMAGASVVGSGRATADGTFAFGLEDGTYTVVSNTTNGIAFENATLTVNGTETLTITGEGVSVPASADPLRCACYLYSRTITGEIEPGVSHVFRLSALPSGNGNSYGADIVEISGTDGLLEVDLLRGKTYLMQRGKSWVNEDTDTVTVNVPSSAGPFELPNVWSAEN